jgi:hypothetical protein
MISICPVEELTGLFFVLFNLEILVQFNFSQNSRTTPIAGHLTVVSACSGIGHLTTWPQNATGF